MPDFSTVQLHTPRLHLRPLVEADVPALFALYSHADVTRYWSHGPWTDDAPAHAMVARDRSSLASGESLRLGLALHTAPEALIGTCSLFNLMPQCRRGEIGYALHPAHGGQGLMHEALKALLNWAIPALSLHRLEADIDPRNTASARSLERLGFEREGVLRERWIEGDEVSDSALYGLLVRAWAHAPAG